ncbi:class I SAM-dependent methyltransferase [Paenibacillus lautus]|uniref:class I SAM-dependent methyltransferase n=1 Tax=Paenibacillus lautus TaxID=1401 RepID=UPI003D2E40E8
MKSLKEYWNHSFQRPNMKPTYDNWLDKYSKEFNEANMRIIDLGCGIGNNSLYLSERGFNPIACDISEEALRKLKGSIPDCATHCFDMSEAIPFDKGSIDILIADLSLHYFDEDTTNKIINNIHSALNTKGLLLCRLNSTKEIVNKGEVQQSQDKYLYKNEGINRRFFDQSEIERFFSKDKWEYMYIEEYELLRYQNKKVMWEIALKPSNVV